VATLIAFGGLPGSGKSTVSEALARRLGAVYVRIDTIEQALRDSGDLNGLHAAGYMAGYALAAENLGLGHDVVADSVNAIAVTRDAWAAVARDAGAKLLEVEVICSDQAEHRRRVETRTITVANLVPPTWAEVVARDYEPWTRAHILIDTAVMSRDESVSEILRQQAAAG
jgi:predicted kinase